MIKQLIFLLRLIEAYYYVAMVITINVYMSNKEKCIVCSSIPENVLVLSCNHCICLLCASGEVQIKTNAGPYFIHCSRCGETTQIDDELYKQLIQLIAQATKIQKKRPQNVLNKEIMFRDERKHINNSINNDLERTCNWHPQYPIMYVCKTCNDAFICPQCVINGCHKNHEANAIQKQGEKIKGKLQQDLSKINEKIEQLQRMQQTRVASIQQRRRQLQKLRNVAKKQYEQIKEAIQKEQNTVIAKCNQLITTHQKEQESFKLDIAYQIKLYEDQRIDLIDLLNPLMQQSLIGQSRALHKMMMVNLVESYKKFAKVCQKDRQNYIKIAQQKMQQDMEVISSLTNKIDRICITNFYHPKPELESFDNSKLAKKYNYPKNDSHASTMPQQLHNRQAPSRQSNIPKNDFFKLL